MPEVAAAKQTCWSIIVHPRDVALDGHGRGVLADIRQLGLTHVDHVRSARVFLFNGCLTEGDAALLARDLLTDPVAESSVVSPGLNRRTHDHPSIEVRRRPGVMDPAAQSTLIAARRLLRDRGSTSVRLDDVMTARRYEVIGARDSDELDTIARRLLANDCIEAIYVTGFDRRDPLPDVWPVPPSRPFELRWVKL